jgi:hypothetical protein
VDVNRRKIARDAKKALGEMSELARLRFLHQPTAVEKAIMAIKKAYPGYIFTLSIALLAENILKRTTPQHRAQFAQKMWHLEVPSKFATKMKGLVELAKTYRCVEAYWGVHAHLSEVTDFKSTASKAKKQVEIAQKHTNYEVSMTAEDLVGVIDLDYAAEVRHPVSGKLVGRYSLRYALLNFVKMGDGRPAIAEAHQSDISKPTYLVVPNTPEAERMIGMMNKNLPAYLYHTLIDYNLPADFVEDLLAHSCEATMLGA